MSNVFEVIQEMVVIDKTELTGQSDQDLISRAVKSDFRAFEILVNRYSQPLWLYVFQVLQNREDANDTMQQILIQVYRSLASLKDSSRFRAWLFTIARNKCQDQFRQKASIPFSEIEARHRPEDEAGDIAFPLQLVRDPAPLADEIIERQETRQLLEEAIATLPEQSRQVVLLRYTTDLSFAEIGKVLNLKENTVKTLFQRSKSQLRFYIRQHL